MDQIVFDGSESTESNVFQESVKRTVVNEEDTEFSRRKWWNHGVILDGLRHSLEKHSKMKKLHQQEEALKVTSLVDWQKQK